MNSQIHQKRNAEQLPQNNFWTLAGDTKHPERQSILF